MSKDEFEYLINQTFVNIEIEKTEEVRLKLSAKWRKYIRRTFWVISAVALVGVIKLVTMATSFKILYNNICPLFANKTNVIIDFHQIFLANEENVCENVFSVSLISDILIIGFLFVVFGFAGNYLERIFSSIPHFKISQNNNIIFYEDDFDSLNHPVNTNYYLGFSGYLVRHFWEIIGAMFCNLLLIFATSVSFTLGFIDWVNICKNITIQKRLIVYTVFDETSVSYYEAENIDLRNSLCQDPFLFIIALLSYLQIILYGVMFILVVLNKSLKKCTNEFEWMLFRLKPHMTYKFHYQRTYVKYIFDKKQLKSRYYTSEDNVQISPTDTSLK